MANEGPKKTAARNIVTQNAGKATDIDGCRYVTQ